MSIDESMKLQTENIGTGVIDPLVFRRFSQHEGTVVRIYDNEDMSVNVWNLEPGQVNSAHIHPNRTHIIMVLTGEGFYLRGEGEKVPIKAGQCIIAPRGIAHGFHNAGGERLSYLVSSNTSGGAYIREQA